MGRRAGRVARRRGPGRLRLAAPGAACAVELQSAFADETAADPELPLAVGIGLDAGEAVPVGDGYRGAALNLAARLCAVAGAGEVLASESLVHLAGPGRGAGLSAARPATTLKGYDEPVAAVRVSAHAMARRQASVPAATGVGRAGPSAAAAAASSTRSCRSPAARRSCAGCAGTGDGRATVTAGRWSSRGRPGIGKTRLAGRAGHASPTTLGATVVYLPAAPRHGRRDRRRPHRRDGPVLVVIDDLDAAPAAMAPEVERSRAPSVGRPDACSSSRTAARPRRSSWRVAERLAPPEQRRTLGPLDADAVRAIVALYAGRATDEAAASATCSRESGGVPAAVHRVASQWARSDRRRAASRPRQTGPRAGRRGLRDAEAALIDDVADLELARERTRLYALDGRRRGRSAASARTICPYKGLAEFEAADADYYFGRERLIAELIARFVGGSFLGLVGDSGQRQVVGPAGRAAAGAGGRRPAGQRRLAAGADAARRAPARRARPSAGPRAARPRALPADDPAAALDAALATPRAGPAARGRRRPVRGGLQRHPRRRRAERLHRPADQRRARA